MKNAKVNTKYVELKIKSIEFMVSDNMMEDYKTGIKQPSTSSKARHINSECNASYKAVKSLNKQIGNQLDKLQNILNASNGWLEKNDALENKQQYLQDLDVSLRDAEVIHVSNEFIYKKITGDTFTPYIFNSQPIDKTTQAQQDAIELLKRMGR
jgi:hypothetical protein